MKKKSLSEAVRDLEEHFQLFMFTNKKKGKEEIKEKVERVESEEKAEVAIEKAVKIIVKHSKLLSFRQLWKIIKNLPISIVLTVFGFLVSLAILSYNAYEWIPREQKEKIVKPYTPSGLINRTITGTSEIKKIWIRVWLSYLQSPEFNVKDGYKNISFFVRSDFKQNTTKFRVIVNSANAEKFKSYSFASLGSNNCLLLLKQKYVKSHVEVEVPEIPKGSSLFFLLYLQVPKHLSPDTLESGITVKVKN